MVDVVTPFFPPADQEKVEGRDGLVSLAHIAAANGDNERLISFLEAGFPVDDKSGGWTLTHCAAANGHVETLELLAARGAPVDENASFCKSTQFEDGTPLSIASGRGDEAVVNKLLSLRADPNKRSRGGCTPLHSACEFGQISVVKILLEAGAKSNAEDNQFETPLDRATFAYNVQYSLSEETVRELEGLLLGVSF